MTVIASSAVTAAADGIVGADPVPHPEDALTRDRWGRPEIVPPDGGRKVGYRRASSFGSPLESTWNLDLWKLRQVARGIARRDDLSIAVTRAEIGLTDPNPHKAKAAKKELDKLCEQAMEVVESGAKASIGTSAHALYERLDLGLPLGHVPTLLEADLMAYNELTQLRFRMVSVERFIVHDELRVAGTLDRAARLRVPMVPVDCDGRVLGEEIPAGEVILADVKTSQDMSFAGCKFAVQCYCYATGTPYNTTTNVREPWGHATPRADWGLIIHAPSGQGTAGLHWVDLTGSREAALHALEVHEWRGKRGKTLICQAAVLPIDYFSVAATAETVAELSAAASHAYAAGAWNEVLQQAFTRRKAELADIAS